MAERQIALTIHLTSLTTESPAATAFPLQQKYVVGVDMRTDTAAGRGIAHHDVVEARVRDERELSQQGVGRSDVEVDALNQQRPIARRQTLQIRGVERSLRQRPVSARLSGQA